MNLFSAVVFITLCFISCRAKTFFLVLDDIPFKSCNMGEKLRFEELFDMSNIQYTRGDDDILVWNGTVKVHPIAANKMIPVNIRSQRLTGGIWVNDILNLQHEDLCTLAFTPGMVHSEMFGNIEPNTCPLSSDISYLVNPSRLVGVLDTTFAKIKGTYKFIVEFILNEKTACVSFQGEV